MIERTSPTDFIGHPRLSELHFPLDTVERALAEPRFLGLCDGDDIAIFESRGLNRYSAILLDIDNSFSFAWASFEYLFGEGAADIDVDTVDREIGPQFGGTFIGWRLSQSRRGRCVWRVCRQDFMKAKERYDAEAISPATGSGADEGADQSDRATDPIADREGGGRSGADAAQALRRR